MFEISIVCHVLCSWFWWVAGVSPVLGVVLVVRLVFWFSGSGLSVCLVPRGSSARLCGGAGGGLRVVPGSGVDVVRPVSIDYRVLVGVGRAGPGCRECFAGVGLRPVLLRLVGWWGVGRVFFRSALLVFSWFPVLVFVVLPGVGGVVGGVGLGSGFFLRLLLYWPGLVSGFLRGGRFGFGLGFVWRV